MIACYQYDFEDGIEAVERRCDAFRERKPGIWEAQLEHLLGRIHLDIVQRARHARLGTLGRGSRDAQPIVPTDAAKAEGHFLTAMELATDLGARGLLGLAQMDLGRLYRVKGNVSMARKQLGSAFEVFAQCGARVHQSRVWDELHELD